MIGAEAIVKCLEKEKTEYVLVIPELQLILFGTRYLIPISRVFSSGLSRMLLTVQADMLV